MIILAAMNPDSLRNVTRCFLGDIRLILEDLGMRKHLFALAAAAAFSVGSAAAFADTVVYNGGAPNQGGQLYAQSPALEAMSFTLGAGSNTIDDANWWGGCFPSTTCGSSPSFTISIYSDSSGSPGTQLDSFVVGAANQTATGLLIGGPGGWDEYSYSASFPALTLTAGTQYWFVLTQTVSEPSGSWGVETTSSTASTVYSMGLLEPLDTWHFQPQNLAFELTDSVPEPSTWAMMLVGFAGLGFLAYRKRSALMAA
jgi:hypothetical protein